MRNIDIAGDLQRERAAMAVDPGGFTPAEFIRDAGTVIVVCLGLALLMQILLR